MLHVKLRHLDSDTAHRRVVANHYKKQITNPLIIIPEWNRDEEHAFHLFVIRVENRNKLQKYLADNGIQTLIHYPIPPHKQSAFNEWNGASLPITELIHNQVLSLPISPDMSDMQVQHVITVCNGYLTE